ncbi:hypothetical protein GCM10009001_35840 [Virgibacillus siamensis]|uniref:Sin domain-containing protein n=1 Tax=Virgibacillus siamensis TaxID=480071 RepID=A0ABN1GNV3_9BACI
MTDLHGKLDDEWVVLIKAARELGLSKGEIRSFLYGHGTLRTTKVSSEVAGKVGKVAKDGHLHGA